MKYFALLAVAALVAPALTSASAFALTTRECAAKFDVAKKAGNTLKWQEFRKAECGSDAAPAAAQAAAKPVAPTSAAVFPAKSDAKYAKETPARARLRTCADQFKANKAANGNGGLKWIEKGGGYWSQCNTRLKGAAA